MNVALSFVIGSPLTSLPVSPLWSIASRYSTLLLYIYLLSPSTSYSQNKVSIMSFAGLHTHVKFIYSVW